MATILVCFWELCDQQGITQHALMPIPISPNTLSRVRDAECAWGACDSLGPKAGGMWHNTQMGNACAAKASEWPRALGHRQMVRSNKFWTPPCHSRSGLAAGPRRPQGPPKHKTPLQTPTKTLLKHAVAANPRDVPDLPWRPGRPYSPSSISSLTFCAFFGVREPWPSHTDRGDASRDPSPECPSPTTPQPPRRRRWRP